MDISGLLKQVEKFTVDNSPAILTGIGIAGVVATAYLTGNATIKAVRMHDEEMRRVGPLADPLRREVVSLVWKLYIPPVVSGTLTIAAIFGANHVNSRRAAGLAAAFSISEKAFEEYRAKVVDKIGEKQNQAIRDEIAQERVDRNPPPDNDQVIFTGGGEVLCLDHYSGRYFKSDMETLRQAQNDINQTIINDGYANLSDLYYEIGLKPTALSEEVGWNTDHMLKMVFSATLSEDNRPCIVMDFDLHPNRKYAHFAGE